MLRLSTAIDSAQGRLCLGHMSPATRACPSSQNLHRAPLEVQSIHNYCTTYYDNQITAFKARCLKDPTVLCICVTITAVTRALKFWALERWIHQPRLQTSVAFHFQHWKCRIFAPRHRISEMKSMQIEANNFCYSAAIRSCGDQWQQATPGYHHQGQGVMRHYGALLQVSSQRVGCWVLRVGPSKRAYMITSRKHALNGCCS